MPSKQPTKRTREIAKAWRSDKSIEEVASSLGFASVGSLTSYVSQLRERPGHASLFPPRVGSGIVSRRLNARVKKMIEKHPLETAGQIARRLKKRVGDIEPRYKSIKARNPDLRKKIRKARREAIKTRRLAVLEMFRTEQMPVTDIATHFKLGPQAIYDDLHWLREQGYNIPHHRSGPKPREGDGETAPT